MIKSQLIYHTVCGLFFIAVCVTELKFHHLPVEEFDSPSLHQMHELHRIVQKAQENHEVGVRVLSLAGET